MARKRMIDPSIWSDDGMAQLTPRQQLLYIGLISNADDDGRLKGSAVAIRLMCPTIYYSEHDDDVIQNDLRTVLSIMGRLVYYEIDGKPYLAFTNYRTWQRIDKPQPSKLPEPSAGADSDNVPRTVAERCENDRIATPPNRIEENRSKGNRREENTLAPKTARKSNPVWDALVNVCGEPATRSEASDFGKTVAELTQAEASPPAIADFALWWDRTHADAQLTHRCYRQHWGRFINAPPPRPMQPTAIKNNLTRAILTTELDDDDDRPRHLPAQNSRAVRGTTEPRRLRSGE